MNSERNILNCLTDDGSIPIEYCFVYDYIIHFWSPESRMIMQLSIRDDELSLACINYLVSRGQVCNNREQIEERAEQAMWENWGQPSTFFD
jgi:hypothetical protein